MRHVIYSITEKEAGPIQYYTVLLKRRQVPYSITKKEKQAPYSITEKETGPIQYNWKGDRSYIYFTNLQSYHICKWVEKNAQLFSEFQRKNSSITKNI